VFREGVPKIQIGRSPVVPASPWDQSGVGVNQSLARLTREIVRALCLPQCTASQGIPRPTIATALREFNRQRQPASVNAFDLSFRFTEPRDSSPNLLTGPRGQGSNQKTSRNASIPAGRARRPNLAACFAGVDRDNTLDVVIWRKPISTAERTRIKPAFRIKTLPRTAAAASQMASG